ncbi:MAG: NADH:flavin oxidoreductase [Actinobacteria bacterium]|nr:NADH:flavin oxidoreductase [Actinomycetota bacterium]
MSILFSPVRLGDLEIKNRFVHSGTTESMAQESGEVTEALLGRYEKLARGGVGLIMPGAMYVQPSGKHFRLATGIHSDDMIPGLRNLVGAVHAQGGKIVFQLNHAGRQTVKAIIGQKPMGPSAYKRDPAYLVKPREMTEEDIRETIHAFGRAAGRAAAAGADGVQIHAAHGYLINQFLSPFFNARSDSWGGSNENRFRFLAETYKEVKANLPAEMAVLVKLNTNDFTPRDGVTPPLAAKYAGWLQQLGIDGVEVSQGSIYGMMNVMRGGIPVKEMLESQAAWKRPAAWFLLKGMQGKFDLEEAYNLAAAKVVKPALEGVPLILVGGMRRASHMEEVLQDGHADLISLSRPLIREPDLVNKFEEGKEEASCVSCNKCFAAMIADKPVRCYCKV